MFSIAMVCLYSDTEAKIEREAGMPKGLRSCLPRRNVIAQRQPARSISFARGERFQNQQLSALWQLVDRARPALLQEPRQGASGEDAAAGLAARAIVGLVLRIHDPLHRSAANRAGLAVAPVHRHLFPEC